MVKTAYLSAIQVRPPILEAAERFAGGNGGLTFGPYFPQIENVKQLMRAFLMLAAFKMQAFAGSVLTVEVSYQHPWSGIRVKSNSPVYLLEKSLVDSAKGVFVFEANEELLLLKWMKQQIKGYSPGPDYDQFRERWPGVPVATAYPDAYGVATFDVPAGDYYVVSFAALRKPLSERHRSRASGDRRILVEFHLWLWEEKVSLKFDEKTSLSLDGSDNVLPYPNY